MDIYIFEQFITELDKRDGEKFFKYLIVNAQEEIDIDNKKYLIYTPSPNQDISLIVEAEKENKKNGKYNIVDFKFHHNSSQLWDFKIVTPMKTFSNTYVVKRTNNTGSSCVRLVLENVLEKELKPGTKIRGQVCGIVINADIYESEESYRNSIPVDKNGNKTIMNDGYIIPYNLITNNDAKLSEEERNNKDHRRDNLLTFKATLQKVREESVNMFNLPPRNYYTATIDTTYGKLDIIIPNSISKRYKGKIEDDFIIVGELLLSCNVCVDKYKKKKKKEEK